MKIKAYTLIEVTLAMLLFGIVMSITYTAYSLINKQYAAVQKKNLATFELQQFHSALERDFFLSDYVLKQDSGILIYRDSVQIVYRVGENIIRRFFMNNENRCDSFKLEVKDMKCYFENNPSLDTIDQVVMTVSVDTIYSFPITVQKLYSARNLFQ